MQRATLYDSVARDPDPRVFWRRAVGPGTRAVGDERDARRVRGAASRAGGKPRRTRSFLLRSPAGTPHRPRAHAHGDLVSAPRPSAYRTSQTRAGPRPVGSGPASHQAPPDPSASRREKCAFRMTPEVNADARTRHDPETKVHKQRAGRKCLTLHPLRKRALHACPCRPRNSPGSAAHAFAAP